MHDHMTDDRQALLLVPFSAVYQVQLEDLPDEVDRCTSGPAIVYALEDCGYPNGWIVQDYEDVMLVPNPEYGCWLLDKLTVVTQVISQMQRALDKE